MNGESPNSSRDADIAWRSYESQPPMRKPAGYQPTGDQETEGSSYHMPQTIATLPEPMIFLGDAPRARTTDPLTSHRAADRSQKTAPSVKVAVLTLVDQFGNLSGEEINGLYATRDGFPKVRYDSPRKRAGELATDGYLKADRSDGLEAVYYLTDAGRVFLEEVSA